MIDIKDFLTDFILSCVSPRGFDRIYNKRFTNTFRLIYFIYNKISLQDEFAVKYETKIYDSFCIKLKLKKN